MIKYRIPYKSYDEAEWLITIDLPSYNGSPIEVKAVEGTACILSYDGGIDDPLDNPVVNTTADIQLYNQGQIDVQELQLSKDRTVVVTVYRNSAIRFKGYLISDGIQREFTAPPYTLRLSATSGLNLLEGMTFSRSESETNSSPLVYLMRILQDPNNLGIDLPIRWATTVRALDASINGDPMTSLSWSADGEGYSYYDVEKGKYIYQNCLFVAEGLVKALQCRIFQADGYWWILDIRKSTGDSIAYSECLNRASFPTVTTGSIAVNKHVGNDLKFVSEDAVLTTKPALDKVNVRYTQSQNDNIIPNGGFDTWKGTELLHWSSSHPSLTVTKHNQINARGGWAVSLINNGSEEHVFRLTYPLPIDAHNLFRRITWGFNMMPKGGYPLTENRLINWNKNEIKASVKYTVNEGGTIADYYLNEFGYWSNKNIPPNQNVERIKRIIAPNAMWAIFFTNGLSFFPGDVFNYDYHGQTGNKIAGSIAFDTTMDLNSGIDFLASKLPNASRGTDEGQSVLDLRANTVYERSFSMTKSNEYYKYLYFSVDKMRIDDVASVKFTGPGNLDVKIIDPGQVDDTTTPIGVGVLSVEFFIKPSRSFNGQSLAGEHLVLDDVWFNVDDNNDIYTAAINDSTVNTQDVTMNISSSFSGFFVSNIMRSYHQSNRDWKFTDGTDSGSLSSLYARMIMGFRNTPLKIFNGTVSTRGHDWSYLNNYNVSTLDGDRFVNLNPRYNTERNEVSLVAMELLYSITENLVVGHNIADISALINRVVSGGNMGTDRPLQDLQQTTEQGNKTTLPIETYGVYNTDVLGVPVVTPKTEDLRDGLVHMWFDQNAAPGEDPDPSGDFTISGASDANVGGRTNGQILSWDASQNKWVARNEQSLIGYATQAWVNSQGFLTQAVGDGRYMRVTHPANVITSGNIANWNTAFGWGNHAGKYVEANNYSVVNADSYFTKSQVASNEGLGGSYAYSPILTMRTANTGAQLNISYESGALRARGYSTAAGSGVWRNYWNDGNFTQTDINKWNGYDTRFVPFTGGTMSGILKLAHSSGLVGSGTSTNYSSFFNFFGANGTTRAGYIGKGSTSSNDFYVLSEIGDIRVQVPLGNNVLIPRGNLEVQSGKLNIVSTSSQAITNNLLNLTSAGRKTSIGSVNNAWFHLNTEATNGFYFYQNVDVASLNSRGRLTAQVLKATDTLIIPSTAPNTALMQAGEWAMYVSPNTP